MKIVFTFSYKTYFKDNTKNYVTNYYVLVFLLSVIFFFAYNMGRREYHVKKVPALCGGRIFFPCMVLSPRDSLILQGEWSILRNYFGLFG